MISRRSLLKALAGVPILGGVLTKTKPTGPTVGKRPGTIAETPPEDWRYTMISIPGGTIFAAVRGALTQNMVRDIVLSQIPYPGSFAGKWHGNQEDLRWGCIRWGPDIWN